MKNLKKTREDIKKSHMYKLKGLLVAMKIAAWGSKIPHVTLQGLNNKLSFAYHRCRSPIDEEAGQ